jgi:endonuclease/exonuclease/phosphatase family metal-dependent hydrolase
VIPPVRALTYNIHGWLMPDSAPNLDQVAEVIAASGADLIGLNEVFHPYPTAQGPALEVLARRLGMAHAFGATVATDPQPDAIPYGNALLSRWPILAYAVHHLTPMTSYGQRGLLETRVALPDGQLFTVYVTHLDHRSEDLRVQQWSAALTWLGRDRSRPHLLMGDLNALSPSDYAQPEALELISAVQSERGWAPPAFRLIEQVMKAGYEDAFVVGGAGPGETWTALEPDRRIDYIFYPAAWSGVRVSCRRWEAGPAVEASDHLPVLAEFA